LKTVAPQVCDEICALVFLEIHSVIREENDFSFVAAHVAYLFENSIQTLKRNRQAIRPLTVKQSVCSF